jgi:hypothetical protein
MRRKQLSIARLGCSSNAESHLKAISSFPKFEFTGEPLSQTTLSRQSEASFRAY